MSEWKAQVRLPDKWGDVATCPSGDAAKTKVRQHQIGRGMREYYRILDPSGTVWLYGLPRHNHRGLRMRWTPPPEHL